MNWITLQKMNDRPENVMLFGLLSVELGAERLATNHGSYVDGMQAAANSNLTGREGKPLADTAWDSRPS
jgi:hypothetical protein